MGIEMSSDSRTLSIASVAHSHAGSYTCVASSEVGDNQETLFLQVQGKENRERQQEGKDITGEGRDGKDRR